MSRPIALLLGIIDHAQKEWKALSDVADLIEITTGTRESITADFKSGKYDGVVAIYRTFDSVKITGRFDAELVSQLPGSVRFICHNGAGYDQIDIEPCTARGIFVSHTPNAVNNATANVAIMLLLMTLRQAYRAEALLRAGNWRDNLPIGHDPDNKVLGILGMGGIGTAFSVRAQPFGMKLIYHNRNPVPDAANPTGARYIADLKEFLGSCDVLSIHMPLTEKTRHFLGKKELAMCKDGVVIVNTARGAVIDEAALVEALESGKVSGVGLDVYEHEPVIHKGLLAREDIVLLPHIGTWTIETQHKMESLVVENVRSALEQGKVITMVSEQRGKEDEITAKGGALPRL